MSLLCALPETESARGELFVTWRGESLSGRRNKFTQETQVVEISARFDVALPEGVYLLAVEKEDGR
jgi:hypothetical protein